jgi:hypothetical protein
MDSTEKRYLGGPMNRDTMIPELPQGHVVDSYGFHRGSTGGQNVLGAEQMKSLQEVQYDFTMPDGINRCLGWVDDDNNNRTFTFWWNSEGNHFISYYDYNTGIAYELITDNSFSAATPDWAQPVNPTVSYNRGDLVSKGDKFYRCILNHDSDYAIGNLAHTAPDLNEYLWAEVGGYLDFDENENIHSAKVIYRNGETLLIWPQKGKEVKILNVDMYLNGEYPADLTPSDLDLNPDAPLTRPYISDVDYDSSISQASLRGRFFKFKYRWVYIDDRVSAWSPESEVPMYDDNSLYTGSDFDNRIKIQAGVKEKITNNIVKSIEMAVKELGDGNSGDWKIFSSLDTDLGLSEESTSGGSAWGLDIGSDTYPFYYTFIFTGNSTLKSLSTDEALSPYSYIPRGVEAIEFTSNNVITMSNYTEGFDRVAIDIDVSFNRPSSPFPGSNTAGPSKTLKSGGTYPVGIIYMDGKGRRSTVYTDATYEYSTDWPVNTGSNEYRLPVRLIVDINHAPPEWAKAYTLAIGELTDYQYLGGSPKFIQFPVGGSITSLNSSLQARYGGSSYQLLYLTGIEAWDLDNFNYVDGEGNKNISYDFTAGDLIKRVSDGGTGNTSFLQYESPVLGVFLPENPLTDVKNYNAVGVAVSGKPYDLYDIVEIKSVKNVASTVFNEFGASRLIGRDSAGNKAHLGISKQESGINTPPVAAISDQVVGTTPARIRPDDGEVYNHNMDWFEQDTSANPDGPTEPNKGRSAISLNGNDWYQQPWVDFAFASRCNDRGLANTIDNEEQERQVESVLRYTQPLAENSRLNKLSLAYAVDRVENSQQYGPIRKLVQYDNRLINFHENKVTYNLVSTDLIFTAEAEAVVGKSFEFLSDEYSLPYEYGIGDHPESFTRHGENMFWVDNDEGVVLQMAGNSIKVISDEFMRNFYNSVFLGAVSYGNSKIVGVYDSIHDEYIIAFNLRHISEGFNSQSATSSRFTFQIDSGSKFDKLLKDGGVVNALNNSDWHYSSELRHASTSLSYTDIATTTSAPVVTSASVSTTDAYIDITTSDFDIASDNKLIFKAQATIGYDVNNGWWSSRWPYLPDMIAGAGIKIISTINSGIYDHNSQEATTFGNVYGVDTVSTIKVPFNENPANTKAYKTIGIRSTQAVDVDFENLRGQQSSLLSTDFELFEGVYWSSILRDENTPNLSAPKTALLDGDYIIGNELVAEIKTTQNDNRTDLQYAISPYAFSRF